MSQAPFTLVRPTFTLLAVNDPAGFLAAAKSLSRLSGEYDSTAIDPSEAALIVAAAAAEFGLQVGVQLRQIRPRRHPSRTEEED